MTIKIKPGIYITPDTLKKLGPRGYQLFRTFVRGCGYTVNDLLGRYCWSDNIHESEIIRLTESGDLAWCSKLKTSIAKNLHELTFDEIKTMMHWCPKNTECEEKQSDLELTKKKFEIINRDVTLNISSSGLKHIIDMIERGELKSLDGKSLHKPSGRAFVGNGKGIDGTSYAHTYDYSAYEKCRSVELEDTELTIIIYNGDIHGYPTTLRGKWRFAICDELFEIHDIKQAIDNRFFGLCEDLYERELEVARQLAIDKIANRLLA